MKERKFIAHLTRNFFLYFWVYLLLILVFNYSLGLDQFIIGMLAYAIGYSPVYFLNDSQDWKEDKEKGRDNLYLAVRNKSLFWIITLSLFLIGTYLGILVSINGYLLMILAYIPNYLHSFKPFQFRNRVLLGSINYFILSLIKITLILSYLNFDIFLLPLEFAFMFASLATFSELIYKRYKQRSKFIELVIGTIFVITSSISLAHFHKLLIFFVPITLMLIYGVIKYKNRLFPVNTFQILFFVYSIIVFLIIDIFS